MMPPAEETSAHFTQIWSEAVQRQANRVRDLQEQFGRLARAAEGDEGTEEPCPQLAEVSRALWTESHQLVDAVHQLEAWSARWAKERSEIQVRDETLRLLRNTLEHLSEADLTDPNFAVADITKDRPDWSLHKLGGRLAFTVGGGPAFRLVSLDEVERRARDLAAAAAAAVETYYADMGADLYADEQLNELRGK